MFSRARISRPQAAQEDRGFTIDSSRGTRWITTFAKLPATAPRTKKKKRSKEL